MKLFNYMIPFLLINTLSYGMQARRARIQERQQVSALIRSIKEAPSIQQVQALNDQVKSLIKNKDYEKDYQALLNTTVSERQAELSAQQRAIVQQPVITQQTVKTTQILPYQENSLVEQFADTLSALRGAHTQELQTQEKEKAQDIIETVRNTNPYKARSMQRDLQLVEQNARRHIISQRQRAIVRQNESLPVTQKAPISSVASISKKEITQAQATGKNHRNYLERRITIALTNQLENVNQMVTNKIKIISNFAAEKRFITTGFFSWIPMFGYTNFIEMLAQPDLIVINKNQMSSLLGAIEANVNEIIAALQAIATNDQVNECNKDPMIRQQVNLIKQKITTLYTLLATSYKQPIIQAKTNLMKSLNMNTSADQLAKNKELSIILTNGSNHIQGIIEHLQNNIPNAFKPAQ